MRVMLAVLVTWSISLAGQAPLLAPPHDSSALTVHAFSNKPPRTGLTVLPAEVLLTANSRRPWGWNDEALWAGRGLSGAARGGFEWRRGPVTVTFAPTLWFAQNLGFDTVPAPFTDRDPLAYPWSPRIDVPQQPGTEPVARFSPGQTGVRFRWRAVTAGVATESLWLGPALRHPILLGATAEGFPHVDLGIRPTSTPIGRSELRVIWGRLAESSHFDTVPGNDARLFAAIAAGWTPRWLPNLTLGFQRVFYQAWTDSLGLADVFAIVQPFLKQTLADSTNPRGDDARDQMLSITWRWHFPHAGFEVYGEWARNDHNWNLRDLFSQPDHSQAWMAGLQYVLPSGSTRLRTEFLHLDRSTTAQIRPNPTFYEHHIVQQGYTHRGQPLGAGPGPGANAQYFALDTQRAGGGWGVWVERIRWFTDDYYSVIGRGGGGFGQMDVTLEVGGHYARQLGSWRLVTSLSLIREINRQFVLDNDIWNLNARAGFRWSP